MKPKPAFDRVAARNRFQTVFLSIAAIFALGSNHSCANQSKDTTAENSITIEVESDKPEVRVAERFQLKISVTAPQGIKIKLPTLESQLGEFQVLSVRDAEDLPFGTNRQWIRRIDLESLVAGQYEIPPIEVSYVDRRSVNSTSGIKSSPTHSIKVRSTLEGGEDPTQFRDIKSVVFLPEPPQPNNHWLIWTAAASGLAIFVASAVAVIRRKQNLTPKQHAIQSLQELKTSVCDPDVEQLYIRLVSILRFFVQEQFEISAPRLTTREFLEAMQVDHRVSDTFRSYLSKMSNLADMVKFAGLLPSTGGLNEVIEQAICLVENSDDRILGLTRSEASIGEEK